MKKNQLFFFLISGLLVSSNYLYAQNDDSLARELIKKHVALNTLHPVSQGYRVQLYFGQQRDKAYEMRTEFIKLFPQTGAYVIYQQPNFKLRVGDFRTRLEAQKALQEYLTHYSSAFVVRDEIRMITSK
ncbi:MAG: SPOR domain-containing protein [Bacteroidetes bacterium]|jgi:hypothetical protein|nr:SPOR domain-containing protein [Bacteroidota bacterium]